MTTPLLTVFGTGDSTVRVFAGDADTRPGDAPVFVLVPGIGMSHRYFRRLHVHLARIGRVYSVDLPGYGANRRPHTTHTVEDTARVIAETLDRLGLRDATVIGHSMGAQFAVELAVERPDLVRGIVLIAPVADVRHRNVVQQALRLAIDSTRETPMINWLVLSDYVRCGIRWYLRQLRPMMTYPIEERIRAVGCRVLVMRGEGDAVATSAWCRDLADRATHGHAAEIEGGAHVIQWSRAEEVGDLVSALETVLPA